MTLLTIAASVATNVSLQPPTIVLNGDDDARLVQQFTTEAAKELERRVDWGALRKTHIISGSGLDSRFPLPSDFSRLIEGAAVICNGVPLRGGLSADEWNSFTSVVGTPRYFRIDGDWILLYPYPSAGVNVEMTYQSKNWTGTGDTWNDDAEEAELPEDLIALGAVWRWKRYMAADFQDYVAEFESMLTDRAKFEGGVRSP